MNEIMGNELYERDEETNALVPVITLSSSLEAGDKVVVRGNKLYMIDPLTNAQIPVVTEVGGIVWDWEESSLDETNSEIGGSSTGYNKIIRYGKLVQLSYQRSNIQVTWGANVSKFVGTVPAKFRPLVTVSFAVRGYATTPLTVTINDDGKIYMYNGTGSVNPNGGINLHVLWLI
jgi:hypothetical protein